MHVRLAGSLMFSLRQTICGLTTTRSFLYKFPFFTITCNARPFVRISFQLTSPNILYSLYNVNGINCGIFMTVQSCTFYWSFLSLCRCDFFKFNIQIAYLRTLACQRVYTFHTALSIETALNYEKGKRFPGKTTKSFFSLHKYKHC